MKWLPAKEGAAVSCDSAASDENLHQGIRLRTHPALQPGFVASLFPTLMGVLCNGKFHNYVVSVVKRSCPVGPG